MAAAVLSTSNLGSQTIMEMVVEVDAKGGDLTFSKAKVSAPVA